MPKSALEVDDQTAILLIDSTAAPWNKIETVCRNRLFRKLEWELSWTWSNQVHKASVVDRMWPAPGSEDTELRCLMEQEAGHGEATVYAGVQG